MHDVFSDISRFSESSKYTVVMELPRSGRNVKAAIHAAQTCDNPYLFQVVSRFSSVCFKTFGEARNYCKQRGWL
ncbi:MAG: hypothetical protein LBJ12_03075 [Oscillospiraceae bacterium]|nr:hypothetical protein [Oscillospiraceae bacterium]